MIKILISILLDECGGLGITRASLVSAVCESTGDDSPDAIVKVRRLVNRRGRSFCQITNWPFLRTTASWSFTAGTAAYSGASYLPATYKKLLYAYFMDGTTKYPIYEMSLDEYNNKIAEPSWQGRPSKVLIHKISSGYWETIFYPTPDSDYTVTLEIEQQWTDLTADASETIITNDYYDAFSLYCEIERFRQQGDMEQYQLAKVEWDNPVSGILKAILSDLSNKPSRKRELKPKLGILQPFGGDHSTDYGMSVR